MPGLRLMDRDLRAAAAFSPGDAGVTDLGIVHNLAPLACYFQLWAHHNAQVLHAVPKHRLLIVKTDEISDRIPDIAAWAGVSSSALRADQAWLFATAQKHRMLARCDPSYVRDTAQRFCGPLMKEYFAA